MVKSRRVKRKVQTGKAFTARAVPKLEPVKATRHEKKLFYGVLAVLVVALAVVIVLGMSGFIG